MSQLTPCPECQRHVRKTETRCPFCGEAVSLTHVPAPALPRKRLGRAATFAFGASVVGATALVACGGDDDDSGASVPVYGAPAAGSSSFAGNDSNGGAGAGAGTAVYGAPAAGFGGSDDVGGAGGKPAEGGAGGANDAGAAPIYGGPPGGAGGAESI
jgi:hypothetical protein